MADVIFHLKPWVDVAKLMSLDSPARRKVYKQWAFRVRSFLQLRFAKFSRGGGDWPPLKKQTIARRRVGRRVKKVGRKTSLLRDTDTMFSALDARFTSKAGAIEQMVRDGIKIGFGGSAKHPKSSMTVTKLAVIHQEGKGHMPQRKIIVGPDRRTKQGMASDVVRGWKRKAK